jgi:hypothetical protein
MIKPLRKRHLQVWLLSAVLIPAGIISAYMVVPKPVYDKLLQEDKTEPLPAVINKFEGKDFRLFLRSSPDKKNYQLQWSNLKGAAEPSLLIYKEVDGEKELIGRIGSAGNYFFPLKEDPAGRYEFILYDIIHQKTTGIIKF